MRYLLRIMANNWSNIPIQMPGGELLPHMSARRRTEMIDALFEGTGGFERARAWIEASDENYGKFFLGPYARGAVRSSNVEVKAPTTLEDIISQLDAGEHAKVINGEANNDGDE